MLKDLVEMIERFESMIQSNVVTNNTRFMKDLRIALSETVGVKYAETICVNVDVNLSSYDPQDPLWRRFFVSYPRVVAAAICQLQDAGFSPQAIDAFIDKKLTLKVDF